MADKIEVVDDEALSPKKEAFFKADSALIRELGERLVGHPHIALAELIKNSYDADATLCVVELRDDEIVVTDNGHGMRRSDFLSYWMTIGTRNKSQAGVSKYFGRNLTGSKGVGRLAAQFLARKLEIETVPRDGGAMHELKAEVDWETANTVAHLTQAKAVFEVVKSDTTFAGGSAYGMRVRMKGLRQEWGKREIEELGQQLWMIQSPLAGYGRLSTEEIDPAEFQVELKSSKEDVTATFGRQMRAAIENFDAQIFGELRKGQASVTVKLKNGDTLHQIFSSIAGAKNDDGTRSDDTKLGFVDDAAWQINVYKLTGRQFHGVLVSEARKYFARFGGVLVYDSGFRLPYYGAEQDWLGIEFDHSHRRSVSTLLPDNLQVTRGLNDLPTQGRLLGVVRISTGNEQRNATPKAVETGNFLKIQVTRDRLVANDAYSELRNAVRWSLDYYAMCERRRLEKEAVERRPKEPADEVVKRIRELVLSAAAHHPADADLTLLTKEVGSLSKNLEDSARYEQTGKALLGPLAAAGMAALALHETRKEFRIGRRLVSRLRTLATKSATPEIEKIGDSLSEWIDRLEATREIFAPLMNEEDREVVESLAVRPVLQHVYTSASSLLAGMDMVIDVENDIYFPGATYAEWHALFQNVFVNASNASLDSPRRQLYCSAGRTGRAQWVRVSDNGHGIDWNRSSEFFEPFNREMRISDERRGLGLGGMGLGLTIVRMIADLRRCKAEFIEPEDGWATTFQLSWSAG